MKLVHDSISATLLDFTTQILKGTISSGALAVKESNFSLDSLAQNLLDGINEVTVYGTSNGIQNFACVFTGKTTHYLEIDNSELEGFHAIFGQIP